MMSNVSVQVPKLRSIQARFDANNPDIAAFKKTLRKSRPYVYLESQDGGQYYLVSRFEDGRNPFTISKAALNVVRPVRDDDTWLGYFFDENTVSVTEAVEAFKTFVRDAVEKKRLEYQNKIARLDADMMGFVSLSVDD